VIGGGYGPEDRLYGPPKVGPKYPATAPPIPPWRRVYRRKSVAREKIYSAIADVTDRLAPQSGGTCAQADKVPWAPRGSGADGWHVGLGDE
jgi:hypothetical protein